MSGAFLSLCPQYYYYFLKTQGYSQTQASASCLVWLANEFPGSLHLRVQLHSAQLGSSCLCELSTWPLKPTFEPQLNNLNFRGWGDGSVAKVVNTHEDLNLDLQNPYKSQAQ